MFKQVAENDRFSDKESVLAGWRVVSGFMNVKGGNSFVTRLLRARKVHLIFILVRRHLGCLAG